MTAMQLFRTEYLREKQVYNDCWGKFYTSGIVKANAPTIVSDRANQTVAVLTPKAKVQSYINFQPGYVASTVNIPK
jgi:hypothetical protein